MYIEEINNSRQNNFDMIRFFCATLVIISHSYPLFIGDETREPLMIFSGQQLTLGGIGVAVFFILSGFLITMSFEKRADFMSFLRGRVLRIFPGLIFMLLLTIFVLGPVFTTQSVTDYFMNFSTYKYFISNVTLFNIQYFLPGVFVNNIYEGVVNGSLWTLFYEFCFYFSIPLLSMLNLLQKKRFKYLVISIFVVNLLFEINRGSTILDSMPTIVFNSVYLFNYFLAGASVYVYKDRIKFNKNIFFTSLILLISFIYLGLPKTAITLFGTYCLFYLSFFSKKIYSNFNKYGDFSYGLYIYAFPVQQIVSYYLFGKISLLSNFVIVFSISLLLSLLSWHIIEKKALRLKKIK